MSARIDRVVFNSVTRRLSKGHSQNQVHRDLHMSKATVHRIAASAGSYERYVQLLAIDTTTQREERERREAQTKTPKTVTVKPDTHGNVVIPANVWQRGKRIIVRISGVLGGSR